MLRREVSYIGGADQNRPYLHPLRSASGKIVNRSFPAGQLAGETTDHPHHAGLFYGHGDVNGYNYWEDPKTQNGSLTIAPGQHVRFRRVVIQPGVSPSRLAELFNEFAASKAAGR